jgi:hypothetical protein
MEIDRILRVAVPTSSEFKQVYLKSVVSAIVFYNNMKCVTTAISQYVFDIAFSFRRGGTEGASRCGRFGCALYFSNHSGAVSIGAVTL